MGSWQCGTLSQGRHAVARACGHSFTCATGSCAKARATTSFRINGYGVPFQTTENSVEFHEAFCRRVKTSFIFGLIPTGWFWRVGSKARMWPWQSVPSFVRAAGPACGPGSRPPRRAKMGRGALERQQVPAVLRWRS